MGKENKLTFLLDTGADLSVFKRSSLQSRVRYALKGGIGIKGISDTIIKTEGTITLKLFTDARETTHTHFMLSEMNLGSNTMVF